VNYSKLGGVKMKYKFLIEMNIHMYNHRISCTYGTEKYMAICESAPMVEETIIFWPDDFGLPANRTEDLIKDLQEWAEELSFNYIIHRGKRC
jgi:hypothetical protein